LKDGTVSSNAVDADTEMRFVLATPPKWHVFPLTMTPYLYDADQSDLTPDFLIRLSIKRVPSSQTGSKRRTYTLIPDGLQHPKFKGLEICRGHYIVCRRAAIQEFDKRGTAPFITHSQHKAALKKK
jgi:hypothetical protein